MHAHGLLPSISESVMVNESVPLPGWSTEPLTIELRITRLGASTEMSQLTILLSITVLAVVIVHGPVYVLSAPLGPVFDGPGKHPPRGSQPSATFATALAHAPTDWPGIPMGVPAGPRWGWEAGLRGLVPARTSTPSL